MGDGVADPRAEALELIRSMEVVQRLAISVIEYDGGVFEPRNHPVPQFVPAELGFLRVVSWLYVAYYETGRLGLEFLEDVAQVHGIQSDSHRPLVQALRTDTQHSLNLTSARDRGLREKCHAWFRGVCGTAVPSGETDWLECCCALLRDARRYLGDIEAVLRAIERDPFRSVTAENFRIRLERSFPTHVVDEMIGEIAAEVGLEVDAVAVRKRKYQVWMAKMQTEQPNADFRDSLRRMIELELLRDDVPLPISGRDLLGLGVPAGKQLGDLLRFARGAWDANRCDKHALLQLVRAEIQRLAALDVVAS